MTVRSFMLSGVLATGGLLVSFSAGAANPPGQQYFTVGMGGGMLTNDAPCPDLPCNGTDSCSCLQASGQLGFSSLKKQFPSGTFTVELSTDKSSGFANGTGGQCFGTGGNMMITTPRGTLTLAISGPECRLGAGGGGPDAAPFGVSIPATIVSGTGGYANPMGTGTLAGTFDPVSKTVLLDLVGYGVLGAGGGQ